MKTGSLLPLIVLALSALSQRDLYAQSKEYTPLQPAAADTIAKASIITQVLPDRGVVFRLKAPDARQVSVLVGFSNPPTAMAASYPLKKDNGGLWSATVGPYQGIYRVIPLGTPPSPRTTNGRDERELIPTVQASLCIFPFRFETGHRSVPDCVSLVRSNRGNRYPVAIPCRLVMQHRT